MHSRTWSDFKKDFVLIQGLVLQAYRAGFRLSVTEMTVGDYASLSVGVCVSPETTTMVNEVKHGEGPL